MSTATTTALGVHSEVGTLRMVLVHRPDVAHVWYGGFDHDWGTASIEGGDMMPAGNGVVLMICAEMPLAAANDGLFPEQFKRLNKAGVPAFGIVASTALASLAMGLNYMGTGGANAFTTLVLMTGITAAIPYLFSALAQLKWRWIDRKHGIGAHFLRDSIVAVLAVVFSILFIVYSRNTGAQGSRSFGQIFGHDWGSWAEWMPFVLSAVALLLGIPVYKRQKSKMSQPEDVPPYR